MMLAVIPARGGSKRIPRKNIKLFAGKPMLGYAISVAQESGLFDAIVVSSEDAEILALAAKLGATPFKRSETLADDYTPTVPVIADTISACETATSHFELVCCIYPAVPFLQVDDLTQALVLLKQRGADYVFPVAAFAPPIQRAIRLQTDGKVSPFFPENEGARTQDLERAYFDVGQFYWGKKSAWAAGKSIHACGYAWPIPGWRAVDIDTPEDWARAEMLKRTLMAEGNIS